MFDPKITKAKLCGLIDAMSEEDFAAFLYCQHMAATFLSVGQFESMLISAMQMCDGVKVGKILGADASRWQQTLNKREALNGSTLGSLITILEKHDIDAADVAYLRWLKKKRDYFVHRLFHDGAWPGNLDSESCNYMMRRLIAIQRWLRRGERNIWRIFERAGFVELQQFTGGGILAINSKLLDPNASKLGSFR